MAVLTANTKRETGKKAQSGNIMAAKVNLTAFLHLPVCFCTRSAWDKSCQYMCNDAWLLQAVSDIVRTTLGPRAMLKMLLDSSGGVYRQTETKAQKLHRH